MHCATNGTAWKSFSHIVGCLVLLASNLSFAAGLGEIEVESGLNQPLSARVGLILAQGETVGDWSVQLADSQRYLSMDLKYPRGATELRVTLLQMANREAEILLQGRRPITELILDIVLVLDDGNATQVRHYPVLIDFPALVEPVQAAIEPAFEQDSEPNVTRVGLSGRPMPTRSRVTLYRPGDDTYGLVQQGENLWAIASRVAGDSGVNIQDLMAAIFQLNPDAFMGNDMSRLKVGMPLILPDLGVDFMTDLKPVSPPAESVDQAFVPGASRASEQPVLEIPAESESTLDPAARLELQGRPDGSNISETLDYWLESDNASTAANMTVIRRDLSFAAAEIETYSSENEILKSRIDGLESRLEKLQTLLSLQADSIANNQQQGESEAEVPDDGVAANEESDAGTGGWTRYALLAVILMVLFGLYVIARKMREDRDRKNKTADLVNRLQSAGRGTSLPDNY